ncbi:MAG: hypothetical protein V3R65_01705 [Acidiferrobacterales bacterium]
MARISNYRLLLGLGLSLLMTLPVNAGFLDDIKKLEDLKKAGNLERILEQNTKKPQKKIRSPGGQSGSFQVNPQYKRLLTLAMQMKPESFDEGFMNDYRMFFIKKGTKECQDAQRYRPRSGGRGVDEFGYRRHMQLLSKQLAAMKGKARKSPAVNRTIVYKTIGRLARYDFKNKSYPFHFMLGPNAGYRIDKNSGSQSAQTCAYSRGLQYNSVLSVNLRPKMHEIRLSFPIPMGQSAAEAYSRKYGKKVDVELTLVVQNSSAESKRNPLVLKVMPKRIRVTAKGSGKVLASVDVATLIAQSKAAAKPKYKVDTSWVRKPKKNIAAVDIHGIRMGMTFREINSILSKKGFVVTRHYSGNTGVNFSRNTNTGNELLVASWGTAWRVSAAKRLHWFNYKKTYSNKLKFDVKTIEQQIRRKYGNPDEYANQYGRVKLGYWGWPKTTEKKLQSLLTNCNEHGKRFFTQIVKMRKLGKPGDRSTNAASLLSYCPSATSDKLKKLLEYVNVPSVDVNIDVRKNLIQIKGKWMYILEEEGVSQAIAAVKKEKEKPKAVLDF